MMAVTEVNGCRWCAWVHGSWRDFLGDVEPRKAEIALLDYARACAHAGRPLDPASHVSLPPEAAGAVRATIAQIEVANLIGNTANGFFARLVGKRPLRPLSMLGEGATVAAALPVAIPLFGAACVMRAIEKAAPPPVHAELRDGEDANLLVHLLAEALAAYLANALVRLAFLNLPFSVPIAICSGPAAATIRIGRGRLVVEDGVSSDSLLLVEADPGLLARRVSGSLLEELGHLRLRRR